MHDFSLGPPVDVGAYDGPLVDGKPLHSGNCEDGVYGCRKCNGAMRQLPEQKLKEFGSNTHQECDWCGQNVPLSEIRGIRPQDEPSCYYEVCAPCRQKHNQHMDEIDQYEDELEHGARRYR